MLNIRTSINVHFLDQAHHSKKNCIITAPPVIALNISFLPNGKKKIRCIALKGKPAATIAWKENIVGNCTYTLTNNDDGTVSVESQLITANNFIEEEQICIINHPAFNEVQNHTIYLGMFVI